MKIEANEDRIWVTICIALVAFATWMGVSDYLDKKIELKRIELNIELIKAGVERI